MEGDLEFEEGRVSKKEINRNFKKNNPYKKREKFNRSKAFRFLKRKRKEEAEIMELESEIFEVY